MKVHLISPLIYPCNTGGVEIFNYYFSKAIIEHCVEINLYTKCSNPMLKSICSKYIHLNSQISFISIFLSLIYQLLKNRDGNDLIHVPYTSNSNIIFPVLFLHKFFKIPYIIFIHGGGLKKWKFKYFHKIFFINAFDIISVSKPIKDEYEKRTGKQIKIIPPLLPFKKSEKLISEIKKQYGFNNDEYIIISVGSLKKIKGSDILLDAFMDLGTKFIKENKIVLIYAGDGPLKKELQLKVKKNKYEFQIKFLGNVSRENIIDLYKIADIYIISSLFEGTPLSLLEAMFNSLPIIGANSPGINNIINHNQNGLLFKSKNFKDLSYKIINLVEDKEMSEKLGKQALIDIEENWNYENAIKQHLLIIQEANKRYL